MHPPCEMMVESFLPAMRALVARRLHEEGFSQGRIASLLGVTQASVSLYLSGGQGRTRALVSGLGMTDEDASMYAALLSEDLKKNPVYAVSTLYSVWSDMLGRGAMCEAHRGGYPFLAQCDVCLKTFGLPKVRSSDAIEHVSEAVSLLEASVAFVRVMPQISVNIAYAAGDASSVDHVVAVPGRIVRVRDRARSFMKPEFGASKHLAMMLLLARSRMGSCRSAINLRFDERMERTVNGMGLRCLVIGGHYPKGADDPVVEALRERLGETREGFDAVVDRGGEGFEPSLYLFADDAVAASRGAVKIARRYSESRGP